MRRQFLTWVSDAGASPGEIRCGEVSVGGETGTGSGSKLLNFGSWGLGMWNGVWRGEREGFIDGLWMCVVEGLLGGLWNIGYWAWRRW